MECGNEGWVATCRDTGRGILSAAMEHRQAQRWYNNFKRASNEAAHTEGE